MTTYYVAKTGSNGNPGTLGLPKLTINAGLALMSGQDRLEISPGTYAERINNEEDGSNTPSGASFAAPTSIVAVGGQVWLAPSSGNHVINIGNHSYIVLDGIRVDSAGTSPSSNNSSVGLKIHSGSHHIRYMNGEIKNGGNGIQIADLGSDHNEILNSWIHDLDGPFSPPFTGIYCGEKYNLIEGCIIENIVGEGMQMFSTGGGKGFNIIRKNLFKRCNLKTNGSGSGIIVGSGPQNQVYNNIIILTAGQDFGAGISVGFGASNTLLANNTIYGNHWYAVVINSDADRTAIRNNIFWQNGSDSVLNQGTNTSQDHNLSSDPKFVDAPGGDFRLQATSPAIDAAVDLSAYFGDDFFGNARV